MATLVLLPFPGSRTRRGTSTIGGVRPGGRSAGLGVRSRSRRRRLPGSGSAASGRRGTTSVAGVHVMGAGPRSGMTLTSLRVVSNLPLDRPEAPTWQAAHDPFEQDARLRVRETQVPRGHADTRPPRHAGAKLGRWPRAVSTMGARAGRGRDAWRTWGSATALPPRERAGGEESPPQPGRLSGRRLPTKLEAERDRPHRLGQDERAEAVDVEPQVAAEQDDQRDPGDEQTVNRRPPRQETRPEDGDLPERDGQ
jgi:hypothetical protein